MHGARDEVVPLPPPFEIVLRGFDRQQVIDHVNALKTRVAALGAERDAALQRTADLNEDLERLRREAADAARQVERSRREAQDATTELDRLQRSPLAAATARIQRMLQMAEDEAAELKTRAEQETTALRESARAEADQLLTETRQLCQRLEAESASRRRAEDAESASRRQRAEQLSEQDIAHRQAETRDWVSDYQTRSVAALYLLMQLAGERLNNRVVKVKRQVAAAKALRSDVTDQLSAVQRLLTEALGVVDQPTPAEQAEQAEDQVQPETEEAAEPSGEAPPPEPAGRTGRSGGAAVPTQQEQTRPLGRPHQEQTRPLARAHEADQPTARFGLHP
jgi:chromosome segregation ATPase